MLCIPEKKFLQINGNLSKIFGAKNHIHFLPQNTFPQTPNLSGPMPFSSGIKNTFFKSLFFFRLEFVLMSCV